MSNLDWLLIFLIFGSTSMLLPIIITDQGKANDPKRLHKCLNKILFVIVSANKINIYRQTKYLETICLFQSI